MSVLKIPTTNDPFYVQRTDLEGREYVLTFDWSSRERVWYLSIADTKEEAIVSGVKLVCSWPLIFRLAASGRRPPGHLFVTTKVPEDDSPPGLDDLLSDGRCELTYVTSDEVL